MAVHRNGSTHRQGALKRRISRPPIPRSPQAKIGTVLGEFKDKTLKSSSGQTVTKPAQAKAIAFSEARETKRRIQ